MNAHSPTVAQLTHARVRRRGWGPVGGRTGACCCAAHMPNLHTIPSICDEATPPERSQIIRREYVHGHLAKQVGGITRQEKSCPVEGCALVCSGRRRNVRHWDRDGCAVALNWRWDTSAILLTWAARHHAPVRPVPQNVTAVPTSRGGTRYGRYTCPYEPHFRDRQYAWKGGGLCTRTRHLWNYDATDHRLPDKTIHMA